MGGQNQGRFYLLGRIHWLPGYWVDGHRRIGGASLIWAYVVELWEPVALMSREKRKWQKPRGERTDAEHWGGPTPRSEEGGQAAGAKGLGQAVAWVAQRATGGNYECNKTLQQLKATAHGGL